MNTQPTPEDLARSAKVDLTLCDASEVGAVPSTSFAATARTALRAWIRRALAADAECDAARETLADVLLPFVFAPDGTVDESAPLAKLAPLAAEKILHLRKLHGEAVAIAERCSLDLDHLREAARRVLSAAVADVPLLVLEQQPLLAALEELKAALED